MEDKEIVEQEEKETKVERKRRLQAERAFVDGRLPEIADRIGIHPMFGS